MLLKRTLFVVLAVLFLTVPCFAAGDTSSVFVKAVGGVLATQHQDAEGEVGATFQIEGIRLVYWNVGMTFRYWDSGQPGENKKEYMARAVVFGKNPNAAELKGEWVPFLTLGGIEFYDTEEEEQSLARMNFDGSVGVIWPLVGMNLIGELGGKRMEGDTHWFFAVGFFFVPKF